MSMRYLFITAIACLAALASWAQEFTFTNGVFFVNEDRYGPNQGSINFYDYNYDEMDYNVYAMVNPSTVLGVTTQHGQLFGGRFFLVSKQANSSEAAGSTIGSRLAVLDAVTLEQQGSILRFGDPDSTYDGRSYCALNNSKGYIATSAGVFVLDVNTMTTRGPIEGTQSSASGDYNSLYYGQCGDMVRFGQYVFAVQQGVGLHVIDPLTDQVIATLPFPHIVTVFVTAGGNLYVANNSREIYDFSGGPYEADFTGIDPVTFEVKDVHELGGSYGALSSWGAWRARMLCVDPVREQVYFYYDEFQNYISRYDFDTREFTDKFIVLPEAVEINWDGTRNHQGLYAAAISFDPHTGDMVVQTTEAAPMYAYQIFNHNWVLFYDPDTWTLKRELRLRDAYWFPAMAVYPDLSAPTVHVEEQMMKVGETKVFSLLDAVKDADNMVSLAVTVAKSADENVVCATVGGLELHLTGVDTGRTKVMLTTDSNGKIATTSFTVTVTRGPTMGDVNMDGYIDVADVTKLIEIILGSVLCDFDRAAGDLDQDGILTVNDVVLLIDRVLNGN